MAGKVAAPKTHKTNHKRGYAQAHRDKLRTEAEARQAASDGRSPLERRDRLDQRGLAAKRERARLG